MFIGNVDNAEIHAHFSGEQSEVEYFGYRDSISHVCIPVWIFVSPDMSSSYFQIISTLVV